MSRVPAGLTLLACVLAGGILWQLAGLDRAAPAVELPARASAPADMAREPPDERAGEWAAALLARPPFSPDRRPPPPVVAGPAAAVPEAPLPRLAGIIVTPQGRRAIFAGQPQPVVLGEGGLMGRFSVQRIEPGEVTLVGPDGAHRLRTAFDPAPPHTSQAPARPGPRTAGLPPIPGSGPGLLDTADATPFAGKLAPSGLDILREQARHETPGEGRP